MKAEIISRECIKPFTQTPPHLKSFNFSLLDQLSPAIYGNMTFFYASSTGNNIYNDSLKEFSNKSKLLKESLSRALALLYPLAGRITDPSTVDCNDEGAFFVEAKLDTHLSEFLNQPEWESVELLLPTKDPETMELANGALLLIQFTSFSCSGVSISLALSHKINDMGSLITFLQSWTAIAFGTEPLVPDWSGSRLFPPRDDLPAMSASLHISKKNFVAKRFVFSSTKIGELKAKAMRKGMDYHPSRVEVVLALLWKCALAAHKAKSGSFKPSVLCQAVNLRKRITPPLPDTTMGNFVWPFMVLVKEEQELDIHDLAKKMRGAFNDFCRDLAGKLNREDASSTVLKALNERGEFFKRNHGLSIYRCSAWCKFPLYDTDFGWGKPLWHVSVNKLENNTISLSDTRSRDGVEAVVTLDEEEMAIFECNEQLQEFATANPNAYA